MSNVYLDVYMHVHTHDAPPGEPVYPAPHCNRAHLYTPPPCHLHPLDASPLTHVGHPSEAEPNPLVVSTPYMHTCWSPRASATVADSTRGGQRVSMRGIQV